MYTAAGSFGVRPYSSRPFASSRLTSNCASICARRAQQHQSGRPGERFCHRLDLNLLQIRIVHVQSIADGHHRLRIRRGQYPLELLRPCDTDVTFRRLQQLAARAEHGLRELGLEVLNRHEQRGELLRRTRSCWKRARSASTERLRSPTAEAIG